MEPFNTWFTITQENPGGSSINSSALYNFGCETPSCKNCKYINESTIFGSCIVFNTFYNSAWLTQQSTLSITSYSDAQCMIRDNQLSNLNFQSSECVYNNVLQGFNFIDTQPTSNKLTSTILGEYNCDNTCSTCTSFLKGNKGECLSVSNYWVIIN